MRSDAQLWHGDRRLSRDTMAMCMQTSLYVNSFVEMEPQSSKGKCTQKVVREGGDRSKY